MLPFKPTCKAPRSGYPELAYIKITQTLCGCKPLAPPEEICWGGEAYRAVIPQPSFQARPWGTGDHVLIVISSRTFSTRLHTIQLFLLKRLLLREHDNLLHRMYYIVQRKSPNDYLYFLRNQSKRNSFGNRIMSQMRSVF